jgi:competence protein ComEA
MRNQSKNENQNPNTKSLALRRLGLLALPALLALGAGPVEAKRQRRAQPVKHEKSAEGVVNINTASEAQLELLPGVGPSKAKAISRYRSKRKFKATYELIRIRGIGRKTYRKLRSYLTVKGPTTLTQRPKRAPRKQQR